MPETELSKRPKKVVLAVRMLYLIVGIGIARTTMTVIRHIDVRSPNFLISAKVLIYVVSLYLIYQTGKGKNWARWSLVVIFAINIPLTILPALESISHNLAHTILGFLQLGLYITVLVLLFHASSTDWFSMRKDSKDQ